MSAPSTLSIDDTVSWKYGGSEPQGTVVDICTSDASIETKNGNQVSRKGDEINPAVKIVNDKGSKIIKKASELIGIDIDAEEEPEEVKDEVGKSEEEIDEGESEEEATKDEIKKPVKSVPAKRSSKSTQNEEDNTDDESAEVEGEIENGSEDSIRKMPSRKAKKEVKEISEEEDDDDYAEAGEDDEEFELEPEAKRAKN